MPSERNCPDCGAQLNRMILQGSNVIGGIHVVSEEPTNGFLSSVRSDEVLTPIPYVCPECRRTLFYAEE